MEYKPNENHLLLITKNLKSMKLSDVKLQLKQLKTLTFQLPNGTLVPSYFHVTEVGKINKLYIDCGGTIRHEDVVSFQLWSANDYNHRLHPEKLLKIIEFSEAKLNISDNLPVEVEYQGETIGKFGLDFNNNRFILTTKQTDCLAKYNCGVPSKKPKLKLSELQKQEAGCTPESGCC